MGEGSDNGGLCLGRLFVSASDAAIRNSVNDMNLDMREKSMKQIMTTTMMMLMLFVEKVGLAVGQTTSH